MLSLSLCPSCEALPSASFGERNAPRRQLTDPMPPRLRKFSVSVIEGRSSRGANPSPSFPIRAEETTPVVGVRLGEIANYPLLPEFPIPHPRGYPHVSPQ